MVSLTWNRARATHSGPTGESLLLGADQQILRTVYAFGSPCDRQYGKLVLRPDGRIFGYRNQRESTWELQDDSLRILAEDGRVTSRFERAGDAWLGHVEGRVWPLSLVPVVRLDPTMFEGVDLPAVVVNSIPKAGTYFLESALDRVGFRQTRLHFLGGDRVYDWRGLPDTEVHKRPDLVDLSCPMPQLVAISQGGILVGHSDALAPLREAHQLGALLLHVRRNLRDVLLSLYRFFLERVERESEMHQFWRGLEGDERMIAFLAYHHDKDLVGVRKIAAMMASGEAPGISIRYEEMLTGDLSDQALTGLETASRGLSARLSAALQETSGQPTPTLLGGSGSGKPAWTQGVEDYFQRSGMADLNRELGYPE